MSEQDNKQQYFWRGNYVTVDMPEQAARECSGQGQCDGPCQRWVGEVKFDFLSMYNPNLEEALRKELKEYGAWDEEELKDDEQNRIRMLWIAACDAREEEQW